MEMAMKVAPRGLPTWRRAWWEEGEGEGLLGEEWEEGREELRRKSWVIAMPMEAKEREVRSQARKVRSLGGEEGLAWTWTFLPRGRREGGGVMAIRWGEEKEYEKSSKPR